MAFKEECGVFGIYGHSEAANMTYLGLYALQHRGQESAGIASVSNDPTHSESNIGEACGSTGAGEQIITPGTVQIHSEKEMGYVKKGVDTTVYKTISEVQNGQFAPARGSYPGLIELVPRMRPAQPMTST